MYQFLQAFKKGLPSKKEKLREKPFYEKRLREPFRKGLHPKTNVSVLFGLKHFFF